MLIASANMIFSLYYFNHTNFASIVLFALILDDPKLA
jgi:hypothetical protein